MAGLQSFMLMLVVGSVTSQSPFQPRVTYTDSWFSPSHHSPVMLEGCEGRQGTCTCEVYSNYTEETQYEHLQHLNSQLEKVEGDLDMLDIGKVAESMEHLLDRIAKLEEIIYSQSVAASVAELMKMQKNVDIMSGLVDHMQTNNGTSDGESLAALEEELYHLNGAVKDLWQKHPNSDAKELEKQIEELQARLAGCPLWYNVTYFRGDTMPVYIQDDEGFCDRYDVEGFGEAVAHRWNSGTVMAWLKDPIPTNLAARTEVLKRRQYDDRYDFELYKNTDYPDYISGRTGSLVFDTIISGFGIVAYNGSIYYPYNHNYIYRYNKAATSAQRVHFPSANTGTYRQNGYETYIDFKTDEYGIYALASTSGNHNKLVVRKIDQYNLNTLAEYPSNVLKHSVCTAFMICGKMYTLDDCTHRLRPDKHHTQYVYDTISNSHSYKAYSIPAKFGHINWLSYNHREKVLFGWDNGHAVTYPIKWVRKDSQ